MKQLCLCKNDNSETYHLYDCIKRIDSCNFTTNKQSKCNHIERNNPSCISTCQDEKNMRLKIAELANQGKQICGICVSTLYKNQI